jgi:hypothetical protein
MWTLSSGRPCGTGYGHFISVVATQLSTMGYQNEHSHRSSPKHDCSGYHVGPSHAHVPHSEGVPLVLSVQIYSQPCGFLYFRMTRTCWHVNIITLRGYLCHRLWSCLVTFPPVMGRHQAAELHHLQCSRMHASHPPASPIPSHPC